MPATHQTVLTRLFVAITERPAVTLLVSLGLIVLLGSGLTTLVKETSVKAFIPADHPARIADDRIRDLFAVSDTVAIAITPNDGDVFSTEALTTLAALTETVAAQSVVRPDRVMSLTTESSIAAGDTGIAVDAYWSGVADGANVADTEARWRQMPPHVGTLVSEDGGSAVILAQVRDGIDANEAYVQIHDAVAAAAPASVTVDIAGSAAVSGYLSHAIDTDARALQPLVFLLVIAFVYVAFRRLSALPGPLLVVAGSAAGAIGLMASMGVPYYAITSALPVIIVAISVADAIHILSAYFQHRADSPDTDIREAVVHAMVTMARPITLTTLTTIAGFVGIGVVSIMPPITEFARYAALGVALAWFFSMITLPMS